MFQHRTYIEKSDDFDKSARATSSLSRSLFQDN